MKTRIATFITAVLMLISITASASITEYQNEASKDVARVLKKELKFPEFVKSNYTDCCALVRIFVNSDGSLTVDCVNSMYDNIREYLTASIEKMGKQEFSKYSGQVLNFKINYKLI